ncbi:MAG: polysaccharide biosynthesis tyrosine autokinase [Planctomycetaceae bacterium]
MSLTNSTNRNNYKAATNGQAGSLGQLVFAGPRQEPPSLKLTEVLSRQVWVIVSCTVLGLAYACIYWMYAPVWHESSASVLVSQRDPGMASVGSQTSGSEVVVSEDILANHMEVLRSRRIVGDALQRHGLTNLPSIVAQLKKDEDSVDYVISHLKLTRGGDGAARDARSLKIAFEHRDPDDAKLILEAVIIEYQQFLMQQLSEAMSSANTLIAEAQDELESELTDAQNKYVSARQKAPVLFQGEGSSNIYVDQFRHVSTELLTLEIKESQLKERLAKARDAIAQYGEEELIPLEALGVIDTESLQRLGVFAGLQANVSRSAEFQAAQPERLEEARAQYTHLLRLMSEKQRLSADFGPGHPEVRKLDDEIRLVNEFLEERGAGNAAEWEETELSPRQLLRAYTGFLVSELASVQDQRRELETLAADAEEQARKLVEFELEEGILRSRVERTQQLFDGLVEQLRDLDMASGMQGYVHELLEVPRRGERVWPGLGVCGVGGIMLGMIAGLFIAVANDQMNQKFNSSDEIGTTIDLPVLGHINRLPVGSTGGIVPESAPEAEIFRMLRTVLLGDVRSGQLRVLTATSPLPGDGKSTLLLNTAASFAQLNIPIVLIEADMRRPTLQNRLAIRSEFGLSDVLQGKCELDEALHSSGVKDLTVLCSGEIPSNPSELLESEKFASVLSELRSRFQLVLIDVGPVLAVSDSMVVAQKSDGMLLVTRPSNDTREDVSEAVKILQSGSTNILGCVVNTFGSRGSFLRKSYYAGYYDYGRKPK